jgi:hypothetical protein
MQAIQTKFIPCTNTRGSRVKAWAEAGSITVSWDHALNVDENHAEAARQLRKKLHWDLNYGAMVGGALPQPNAGYAFVFVNDYALKD